MMFDYLIDKLEAAPFQEDPFKHIYIDDFFSNDHFKEIIATDEISIAKAESDVDVIDKLRSRGYEAITFPGTTTDLDAYVNWHKTKGVDVPQNGMTYTDLCEGLGVTFRLQEARSATIQNLMTFLQSEAWLDAIAAKFSIDRLGTRSDGGIQKYLDGYEISPHPDIRAKALTYMVNINPSEGASEIFYHTHYMRFREEKSYIQEFWKGNLDIDRCWVPWSWCETVKTQSKNNTIVLFQPSHDTLHAVRADYNHLETQRTQLYGNLWYNAPPATSRPVWKDLDLRSHLVAS